MTVDQEKIQQAKARLGIIGNSPELTQAVARALRVAPIDLSVLVTGEHNSQTTRQRKEANSVFWVKK
ncbi:MAG: sigma-54 factor interaction domain-containing protein, partial [Muribaculaceae bacterium]|nr:sigma-54 factor interaction domain-containing protein [Muribaculaceae bacterium]